MTAHNQDTAHRIWKVKNLSTVVAAVIYSLYDNGDNGGDRVDRIDGDMGDGPDNHTGDTFVSESSVAENILEDKMDFVQDNHICPK